METNKNKQNSLIKRALTPEVKEIIKKNQNRLLHSEMERMWQENHNLSVQEAIAKVEQFAQAMGI